MDRAVDPDAVLDDRYLVLSSTRVISRGGGLILEIERDDDAADALRLKPGVVSVTPR